MDILVDVKLHPGDDPAFRMAESFPFTAPHSMVSNSRSCSSRSEQLHALFRSPTQIISTRLLARTPRYPSRVFRFAERQRRFDC